MKSSREFVRYLPVRLFLIISILVSLTVAPAIARQSIMGTESPAPLPVEEAFASSVEISSDNQLRVVFDIEDGYYLYKKKLSYTQSRDDLTLGQPAYPKALIQEDEFFGESEVFRDKVEILLPVSAANELTGATDIDLTVGFQGCADIGLCYPPTTATHKVSMSSLGAAETGAAETSLSKPINLADLIKSNVGSNVGSNAVDEAPTSTAMQSTFNKKSKANKFDISSLQQNSDGADRPLLRPTEAFIPSIVSADGQSIVVQWFIEPDYYLYRDKLNFELRDAGGATVASHDVDRGTMQSDPYFGEMEILRDVAEARLTISNAGNASNGTLDLFYQGCADIGVCFPPEKLSLPLVFSTSNAVAASTSSANGSGTVVGAVATAVAAGEATTSKAAAVETTNTQTSNALPVSDLDRLSNLLGTGNLALIALAFYGAGLLLAFTACVYPMIPILSSLIVGQGENLGAGKAFSLSLVYVLSMASVFALVGILVGMSGYNIQPLFQNPWVLTAFALLFVLLALSMFGLYRLEMPGAIQAKMTELSNKQKGGSYAGVAVMGTLSALIVGPCVTPPLVAALAYIANTGNAAIGGIALFAIGIGMGTPLLLIGTSLGRFMPKAGGWMDTMQRIFGIILLAVAIYMLSRFLPASAIMILSAMLAIFAGVFFGATDKLDADSRGVQRFGKSAGLIAVVYGIALMVGVLSGNNSLISPLRGLVGQQTAGTAGVEDTHVTFQRVKSTSDLDQVLAQASSEGRPVMLDFYADWCVSCKEMEAFTFPDPAVKKELNNAVLVQADVTKNDADDKAMLKRFGLFGPPGIILYDQQGSEIQGGRVVGFMSAEKFSKHLAAYLNNNS